MADDSEIIHPNGMIRARNPMDIMFYMMEPDIIEIVKHNNKDLERIKDILDVLLEVIEKRNKGTEYFFSLVELVNSFDKAEADYYLHQYEDVMVRKSDKIRKNEHE